MQRYHACQPLLLLSNKTVFLSLGCKCLCFCNSKHCVMSLQCASFMTGQLTTSGWRVYCGHCEQRAAEKMLQETDSHTLMPSNTCKFLCELHPPNQLHVPKIYYQFQIVGVSPSGLSLDCRLGYQAVH